jgi:hypothetical protein
MTTQKYQYDSSKNTMAFALVKAGIVPDERRLCSESVEGKIIPRKPWSEAPKVERIINPREKERQEEIMANVPVTTPKDKEFYKHLRLATWISFCLDRLIKMEKALQVSEDTINEHYFQKLQAQIEKKTDQLDHHLNQIGA